MFSKKLFIFISIFQIFPAFCPPKGRIPKELDQFKGKSDRQGSPSSSQGSPSFSPGYEGQGSPSFSPGAVFILPGQKLASPTSVIRRIAGFAFTELETIINPAYAEVSLLNIGIIINSPIFDHCFFKVLQTLIEKPFLEGFGIIQNSRRGRIGRLENRINMERIADSIKNRALRLVECQSKRSSAHVCDECFPHHFIKRIIEVVLFPCLENLPEEDNVGTNREEIFCEKLKALEINFNDEFPLFCKEIKDCFIASSPRFILSPSPLIGSPISP